MLCGSYPVFVVSHWCHITGSRMKYSILHSYVLSKVQPHHSLLVHIIHNTYIACLALLCLSEIGDCNTYICMSTSFAGKLTCLQAIYSMSGCTPSFNSCQRYVAHLSYTKNFESVVLYLYWLSPMSVKLQEIYFLS